MKASRSLSILLLWVLITGSVIPAAAQGTEPSTATLSLGVTSRVSIASSGAQANGWSLDPAVSTSGRYIAFQSWASNLVSDDTNGVDDIFVRDLQTGQTARVSVASDGSEGNSFSYAPALSADGRYVAFCSGASNLVTGDSNGTWDVFVHDRQTGQTSRVSVATGGGQGNGESRDPAISDDGRYVAFWSWATNLVSDDNNGVADIFVHDRQTGQTSRVSVSSDEEEADGDSFGPSISSDGRYVAFYSSASDLVSYPVYDGINVYLRDRQGAGETVCASRALGGGAANGRSFDPSLSDNGRYVAFASEASNLVSGDSNGVEDVFVYDRQTGQTTRISVASGGGQATGWSDGPSISGDGLAVAFTSNASNLVTGDSNGKADIFVRHWGTDETARVSISSLGAEANDGSQYAALSTSARYVAFSSQATNLVRTDTNGEEDIFLRDTQGVPPPELIAVPTLIPANGTSSSTITLWNGPVGHQVRLVSSRGNVDTFTQASGAVGSDGKYATTLRSSIQGTAILTAQDVTTGETFATSDKVTFTGPDIILPPTEGAVDIVSVNPQYPLDGRYLQGISVPNRVTVKVNWKGLSPGRVDFALNDHIYSVTADASGASRSFDMGRDLQPGDNTLRITAYDAQGQASNPQSFSICCVPLSIWLDGLRALSALTPILFGGSWSSGYEFSAKVNIPPDGIKLGAPKFGPAGSKNELKFGVGGGFTFPLYCDRPIEIYAEGGFETKMELTSVELGGELKGKGSLEAQTMVCEMPTLNGNLEISIKVYGKKSWPLLTFVANFVSPAASETINAWLPGSVKKVVGEVYLQADLSGKLATGVETIGESPYLEWQGVELSGGPGLEAGYELKKKVAELKIYLRVSGEVSFVNPNPLHDLTDLHFDSLTLAGEAGFTVKVAWWETGAKYTVEWTYPEGMLQATPLASQASGWHLIGHNASPTYAAFQAQVGAPQAFNPPDLELAAPNLAAQATVTSVLVSDVYTYPQPSLAIAPSGKSGLLLWEHDDVAKEVGQSHEIEFSFWDGSTWTAPAGVTADESLDGAPQVAWVSDETGVAVWERIEEPLPPSATWDATTARQIEIATSTYDAGAGTWSPVDLLTENKDLDCGPQLARNPAEVLLAVWRRNGAGVLGGGEEEPDSILASFYEGGWSPPVTAVKQAPDLAELAAGLGMGQATIAFTRLITPTSPPSPTLQLFTTTWEGTWSEPVQQTSDSLDHRNPQVIYNGDNQPLLIWVAGDELRLRNLTTGETASLALEDGAAIDQLRAVQDSAGQIIAVFTAQQTQRDLYLAFYDRASNTWGGPLPLTNDQAAEGYPSAGLDSKERLLMAYAVTSGGAGAVAFEAPPKTRTDLVILSHEFVRNLTLGAGDLAVSDDHPTPGSSVTLSATVHNSGDLVADGVVVAFYDGDPGAGGTLIGNRSLPAPLPGGFTATLTIDYAIPTTGGAHVLYAVADPDHAIDESNELDNTASLPAFGPDLEVADAGVEYWGGSSVGLRAWIRNVGTSGAAATTLTYHRDGPGGPVLTSDAVPALAAGEAVTLTTPWNSAALGAGDHQLIAAVNEHDFPETFAANNVLTFTLSVRPDLMVSPYYVWTTAPTAPTVIVTATVYNVGATAATDVLVGFYGDDRLDEGNPLLTRTIPSLAPGSATQISGQVPGPLGCTLYVYADPARAVSETTRANNLAGVGYRGRCYRVYLPLVLRAR